MLGIKGDTAGYAAHKTLNSLLMIVFDPRSIVTVAVFFAGMATLATVLLYGLAVTLGPFVGLLMTRYWYVALALCGTATWLLLRVVRTPRGQRGGALAALLMVWLVGVGATLYGTQAVKRAAEGEAQVIHALARQGSFTGTNALSSNGFVVDILPDRDRNALEALAITPMRDPRDCKTSMTTSCYLYETSNGERIHYQVSGGMKPFAISTVLSSPRMRLLLCAQSPPPADCLSYASIKGGFGIDLLRVVQGSLQAGGVSCSEHATCARFARLTGEWVTPSGLAVSDGFARENAPAFREVCVTAGRLADMQCDCYARTVLSGAGRDGLAALEVLYSRRLSAMSAGEAFVLSNVEDAVEAQLEAAARSCSARGF
jgi:hypothetical protein